jgi:hypothetical protein
LLQEAFGGTQLSTNQEETKEATQILQGVVDQGLGLAKFPYENREDHGGKLIS